MKESKDIYRFFGADLSADLIILDSSESHHAANVLRLRQGEQVELFDGRGGLARGTIESARKSEVNVRISHRESLRRQGPAIHLAFAVPKGKRLDWLLEKATELGAAWLHPIIFERSVAGGDELSDNKYNRWLGHCVSAAKQCGLNFLPQIAEPQELSAFLPKLPQAMRFYGELTADALTVRQVMEREFPSSGTHVTDSAQAEPAGHPGSLREIVILVGPEGGLTEGERQSLRQAGYLPVRLGQTVLRIETAAIALLAAATAMT